MNENAYQKHLAEWLRKNEKDKTFFQKLPLKYEIGKYSKGKVLGMPDCEIDIVEVDESNDFHLWELKLLESNELNTGKFFGQLVLYDFLFASEPWNELLGRFLIKNQNNKDSCVGSFEHIIESIMSRTNDDNTQYSNDKKTEIIGSDSICKFKTWKLVVCGGKGYELAAGFNPIIWSYLLLYDKYFKDDVPKLEIYHFYQNNNNYELNSIKELSVLRSDGLPEHAKKAFEHDFPDYD